VKCYIGLHKECVVYKNILKNLEENIKDKEKLEEKKKELLEKYLDFEQWFTVECSYCIKAHAEVRRRRLTRIGVGVTI